MNLIINSQNIEKFCKINDFLLIDKKELKKENIYLNLVYATKNNFLNTQIYPNNMPLIINANIWNKLKNLNKDLKKLNMCITIYDSFRPIQVQEIFWDVFYQKKGFHDELLVANPKKYGSHNIKINAIDIMPTKLDGTKIELPCEFDDFTEKASVNYDKCSKKAKENRDILISLAKKNGLIANPSEWWHYYDEEIYNMGLNCDYKNTKLIPKEINETFKLIK